MTCFCFPTAIAHPDYGRFRAKGEDERCWAVSIYDGRGAWVCGHEKLTKQGAFALARRKRYEIRKLSIAKRAFSIF